MESTIKNKEQCNLHCHPSVDCRNQTDGCGLICPPSRAPEETDRGMILPVRRSILCIRPTRDKKGKTGNGFSEAEH